MAAAVACAIAHAASVTLMRRWPEWATGLAIAHAASVTLMRRWPEWATGLAIAAGTGLEALAPHIGCLAGDSARLLRCHSRWTDY
jgi:hypothetical protein